MQCTLLACVLIACTGVIALPAEYQPSGPSYPSGTTTPPVHFGPGPVRLPPSGGLPSGLGLGLIGSGSSLLEVGMSSLLGVAEPLADIDAGLPLGLGDGGAHGNVDADVGGSDVVRAHDGAAAGLRGPVRTLLE